MRILFKITYKIVLIVPLKRKIFYTIIVIKKEIDLLKNKFFIVIK